MTSALFLAAMLASPPSLPSRPDTVRIEVGSRAVNARVYKPHRARVRVRDGGPDGRVTNEWVNELTLGDSAGRPIMRWITTSMIGPQAGNTLKQTYDGETMAPIAYLSQQNSGASTQFQIEGNRVVGSRRTAADSTRRPFEMRLDRAGFMASASDLIPLAVGMRPGLVIIAPVWGLNMATADERSFTIVQKVKTPVEGQIWDAWKVDERRTADHSLVATWYLVEDSPYMVAGEMVRADGGISYASEVALDMPASRDDTSAGLASRGR